MSADKYPNIFSCQMEAIVYLAKTFPDVQRGMSRNSLQNFNKLVGLLINEPVVSEVKETWRRDVSLRTAFTLVVE